MSVVALCFAPAKAVPMTSVGQLALVAGAGITGDHFYGTKQRHPGQNITLLEAEEIAAFNARNGTNLTLTDPRRNVVTRGVRLNALVGQEFVIGAVRFRGVELCEPCGKLARYLAGGAMTRATFVREFVHRCGLRADVISSGIIRIGDKLHPSQMNLQWPE
jgi:MOSC domain-containing protein YiiM